MTTRIELGQALRQLPLEAPASSLWPALQTHVPEKRATPAWPLALAASTALLTLLFFTDRTQAPPSADQARQAAAVDINRLMDRSAQLENSFYALQDDDQSSATVIAANLGIEDRLQAIDSQLAAQPASDEAARLWQQRIALLDQGVALNRTNAAYRAEGNDFDLALASLN
jgi:hypothetical protein